jgi:hypothetical protein
VAGGSIAARVGVKSVADPAGIAGTKSFGDVTISGDVAFGNFLDERIDLIEEIHIAMKN